jgi:hypothetical protein
MRMAAPLNRQTASYPIPDYAGIATQALRQLPDLQSAFAPALRGYHEVSGDWQIGLYYRKLGPFNTTDLYSIVP